MTKWGILGCAGIARKNIRAISLADGNELVAVASRSIDTARTFAAENKLSPSVQLYGSYDSLLADTSVNAVYIPLPTAMHLEWVTKAAKAKKHVLVEKPCALNKDELKKILQVCDDHGVLFMDGVMFMHHTRTHKLRSLMAKDPFFGSVERVNSSFSFLGSPGFLADDIRCKASADRLGALGDLGWYNIRLAMIAFAGGRDYEVYSPGGSAAAALVPVRCSARASVVNSEGVPLDCEGIVWFASELDSLSPSRYLRFDCSFLLPYRCSFELSLVSGVRGVGDKVVRCEDFAIPKSNVGSVLSVESHAAFDPFVDHATKIASVTDSLVTDECCQEAEMIATFGRYVSNTLRAEDPPAGYWGRLALWNQAVVDACFQSLSAAGAHVDIIV